MTPPKLARSSSREISMALRMLRWPRAAPTWWTIAVLKTKSPIQFDSGTANMFGCCPRHQVSMLVPERGEPTTKIGLFILFCIPVDSRCAGQIVANIKGWPVFLARAISFCHRGSLDNLKFLLKLGNHFLCFVIISLQVEKILHTVIKFRFQLFSNSCRVSLD